MAPVNYGVYQLCNNIMGRKEILGAKVSPPQGADAYLSHYLPCQSKVCFLGTLTLTPQ